MRDFEHLVKSANENHERRTELLESIQAMHGRQAAATAMAIAEFHFMMSNTEKLLISFASAREDTQHTLMAVMGAAAMRRGIVERTIYPLISALELSDKDEENYAKLVEQVVFTFDAFLKTVDQTS